MNAKAITYIMALFVALNINAQVFKNDVWEQKNVVSLKVSQLYYEVGIGANLFSNRKTADFIYMSFGYGKPTRRNAWRKFLPGKDIPANVSQTIINKLNQSNTDGIHAGKIGIGWNHWFNHVIGFYLQIGWGFIADISTTNPLTEEEEAQISNSVTKKTFIYNTVPIEMGFSFNMWRCLNAGIGITYMWKEIPLLTIGIGYTF